MAARTPICPTDICAAAKTIGNRPQAIPSLRLFTSPAWLTDERFRSRAVVRQKTSLCVGTSASGTITLDSNCR